MLIRKDFVTELGRIPTKNDFNAALSDPNCGVFLQTYSILKECKTRLKQMLKAHFYEERVKYIKSHSHWFLAPVRPY